MPASGFDCYLQDARNNFDAVRPAPIPSDGSVLLGQSQNIHISTNCYYGYHGTKSTGNMNVSTDCEMMEVGDARGTPAAMQTTAKKRSAGVADYPQSKRLRQELMHSFIQESILEYIKPCMLDKWPHIHYLCGDSKQKYKERILNLRQMRLSNWTQIPRIYWSHCIGTLMEEMILPYAALLAHGQVQAIPLLPLMQKYYGFTHCIQLKLCLDYF